METADERMGAADESMGTTDEPMGTTDEPMGATDEPMGATDEPMGTTDEPTGTTDEPTGTTDEPTGRHGGSLWGRYIVSPLDVFFNLVPNWAFLMALDPVLPSLNSIGPQRSRSISAHSIAEWKMIPRSFRKDGMTIVEGMVATGMLAVALAGVFATFGRTVSYVRLERNALVAQQNDNSRFDQLRAMGWAKVTNPSSISTLLTSSISSTSSNINITKEVITVYPATVPQTLPLPSSTPSPTTGASTPYFTVTRTGTSAPVISPSTFDATTTLGQMQLNYRISTEWQVSNKTHKREMSTVISRSATR